MAGCKVCKDRIWCHQMTPSLSSSFFLCRKRRFDCFVHTPMLDQWQSMLFYTFIPFMVRVVVVVMVPNETKWQWHWHNGAFLVDALTYHLMLTVLLNNVIEIAWQMIYLRMANNRMVVGWGTLGGIRKSFFSYKCQLCGIQLLTKWQFFL